MVSIEATPATSGQNKKPSFDEYPDWLRSKLDLNLHTGETERLYILNSGNARNSVNGHGFFAQFDGRIKSACELYKQSFQVELLMSPFKEVVFDTKEYSSVINKSYRQNVLSNDNYPSPPEGDWITPSNWYGRINDIIRCRLVCKFIDGPQFLAERLKELAGECGVKSEIKPHNREGGYYAYHFYVWIPVGLMIVDGNGVRNLDTEMMVEVQLTTQPQEVLYDLTHGLYEELRIKIEEPIAPWQWDYSSPRFKPSYMGHTLHMLEAIILEVRNWNTKVKENNDE